MPTLAERLSSPLTRAPAVTTTAAQVPDVATARLLTRPASGTLILVASRDTVGDGLGGIYEWDPAETLPDDDGATSIALTGEATGRLIRIDDNAGAAAVRGEIDAITYGVPVDGDPVETREALTAAIAYAVENDLTLVLPPGVYNVHGLGDGMSATFSEHAVQVPSGARILGRGGVIKLVNVDPDDAENTQGLSNWPTNCALSIVPGAEDIRIDGVTFRGENDPFVDVLNNQTAAIYAGGLTALGAYATNDRIEVVDCKFENLHGFTVHSLTGRDISVRNCKSRECANGINTNGANSSVIDCEFYKGEGIEIAGAGEYGPAINNATNATPIVVTTAAAHGLADGDYVYVKNVAGNTAANGTWAVEVLSPTTFSLLDSVGNGAYTSGGSFALANAGRIRITGCVFRKMGLGGAIAIGGTDVLGHSAIIANNIIDESASAGIIVADGIDELVIAGNTLRRIVNPAIQFEKVPDAGFNGAPQHALVQGNFISDCESHGIYVNADCQHVRILGNVLRDIDLVGIYGLSASHLFVDGNDVAGDANGFHFASSVDVVVTANNRFANAANAGFVADNNATVSEHAVSAGAGTSTLSFADFARQVIVVSGSPAVGDHTLLMPAANGQSRIIRNDLTGGGGLIVKNFAGTGPTIASGEAKVVYCDDGNWKVTS